MRLSKQGLCARWLSSGLLLLATTFPAGAEASADPQRSAPFWRDVGRPGLLRAHELLAQAISQMREAEGLLPEDWRAICGHTLRADVGPESLAALEGRWRALRELLRLALRRTAHLDNAEARLRRARVLAPADADVQYALARLLMTWEQPLSHYRCRATRRDQEALAVLDDLQEQHPKFMAESTAFDRAVLLTRLHRFAEAASAYKRAMTLSLDGGERAVLVANLAEVTMLAGDLDASVKHYERARALSQGNRDHLLATWGLAVALDRLGEHEEAIGVLTKAIAADGGSMRVLRDGGVFFEPEHERDYYEALGYEALAQRKDGDRSQALDQATASFGAYLAASAANDPFVQAAAANLKRLRVLQAATPKAQGKAQRARPTR